MPVALSPKKRSPLEDGFLYILIINSMVGFALLIYYIIYTVQSSDLVFLNNSRSVIFTTKFQDFITFDNADYAHGNVSLQSMNNPLGYQSKMMQLETENIRLDDHLSNVKNNYEICEGFPFESDIIQKHPYVTALVKNLYSDHPGISKILCNVIMLGPYHFLTNSQCFQEIQYEIPNTKNISDNTIDVSKYQYNLRSNSIYWSTMGYINPVDKISFHLSKTITEKIQEIPSFVIGYTRDRCKNYIKSSTTNHKVPEMVKVELIGWIIGGRKKYDSIRKIGNVTLTVCGEFELCANSLVLIDFCVSGKLDYYAFENTDFIGFQKYAVQCDISGVLSEVLRFIYWPYVGLKDTVVDKLRSLT